MRANRPQLCVDFDELPPQGQSHKWPPVRGENFQQSCVAPGWEGMQDLKWKELFANRIFHPSDYQTRLTDRAATKTASKKIDSAIQTPCPGACVGFSKSSDGPREYDKNKEPVKKCIRDINFMVHCGIDWDRVSRDGKIGRSLETFQQWPTDNVSTDGHMIFPQSSVDFVNSMNQKYIKKLLNKFREGLKFANSLDNNSYSNHIHDYNFFTECGVDWHVVDPGGNSVRAIRQVGDIIATHTHLRIPPEVLAVINSKYADLVNALSRWLQRNLNCLSELDSFSAQFYRKPERPTAGNRMSDLIHDFWRMNKIVHNPISEEEFLAGFHDKLTPPIPSLDAEKLCSDQRENRSWQNERFDNLFHPFAKSKNQQ
jgi:hypothetical protein